jgi:hypothetical protein
MSHHRSNHDKIDELIRQADEPIVKAVLMLISKHETTMQTMVDSLNENTEATKRIATSLSNHVAKEEVFQTKIEWSFIGGRVVGVILFGALAALAGYVWNRHIEETATLQARYDRLVEQVTINTQRLKALEHPGNGNGK